MGQEVINATFPSLLSGLSIVRHIPTQDTSDQLAIKAPLSIHHLHPLTSSIKTIIMKFSGAAVSSLLIGFPVAHSASITSVWARAELDTNALLAPSSDSKIFPEIVSHLRTLPSPDAEYIPRTFVRRNDDSESSFTFNQKTEASSEQPANIVASPSDSRLLPRDEPASEETLSEVEYLLLKLQDEKTSPEEIEELISHLPDELSAEEEDAINDFFVKAAEL